MVWQQGVLVHFAAIWIIELVEVFWGLTEFGSK